MHLQRPNPRGQAQPIVQWHTTKAKCSGTRHTFFGPNPPQGGGIYDLFISPWVDVYIISKDPKKASEVQSWEQSVANGFLGKNMYTKLSTNDRQFCP